MTIVALARMVKLSHSLFALPFAASAVVLVAREASLEPWRLALVAIAVVAARTAAMAMNRIADPFELVVAFGAEEKPFEWLARQRPPAAADGGAPAATPVEVGA